MKCNGARSRRLHFTHPTHVLSLENSVWTKHAHLHKTDRSLPACNSPSLQDGSVEFPYIWSHTCQQTCLAAILVSITGVCILARPLTSCTTTCFTCILNWKVAASCIALCGHALFAQTFYLNKDADRKAPYVFQRSDSLHCYSAVICQLIRHIHRLHKIDNCDTQNNVTRTYALNSKPARTLS